MEDDDEGGGYERQASKKKGGEGGFGTHTQMAMHLERMFCLVTGIWGWAFKYSLYPPCARAIWYYIWSMVIIDGDNS